MAGEPFDIIVTEKGASTARAAIDGIADAGEKAEAAIDGLNKTLDATSPAATKAAAGGSTIANAFRGVPGILNQAFGTGLIKDFGNMLRPIGGIASSIGAGLREGAAAGWQQSAALHGVGDAAGSATKNIESANGSIDRMGSGMKRTVSLVTSLATAMGARQFIEFKTQIDEITSSLGGISQYGASVQANLQRIGDISAMTGTSMKSNADALVIINQALSEGQGRVQQYAGGMNAVSMSTMTATQMLQGLAGTFQRGGDAAIGAAKAQAAWTQAVQDGSLSLSQYSTIAQNSRLLAAGIAQAFGTTTQEFSKYVAQGKISSQMLIQLTQQATAAINQIPPPQPTIQQGFDMITQSMLRWVSTSTAASSLANGLANAMQFLSQNIGTVMTVVGILTGVFAALVAVQVGIWVWGLVAAFGALIALLLPFAPAIIAIGVAVGGLVALFQQINQTAIAPVISAISNLAGGVFQWLVGSITTAETSTASLSSAFLSLTNVILSGLGTALSWLDKTVFGGLIGKIGEVIDKVKSLGNSIDSSGENARKVEAIMRNYNGVLTETKAQSLGLTDANKNLAGSLGDAASGFDRAKTSADGYTNSLNNMAAGIYGAVAAMRTLGQQANETWFGTGNADSNYREGSAGQGYTHKGFGSLVGITSSVNPFIGQGGQYQYNVNGLAMGSANRATTMEGSAILTNNLRILNAQLAEERGANFAQNIRSTISTVKSAVSSGVMSIAEGVGKLQSFYRNQGIGMGSVRSGGSLDMELQTAISELTNSLNDNTSATRDLSGQLSPQGYDPTQMGRVFVPNSSGFVQEMQGASRPSATPQSAQPNWPGRPNQNTTVRQTVIIQTANVESFQRSRRQIATDVKRSLAS